MWRFFSSFWVIHLVEKGGGKKNPAGKNCVKTAGGWWGGVIFFKFCWVMLWLAAVEAVLKYMSYCGESCGFRLHNPY